MYNEIEAEQRKGGKYEAVKGFASKAPEQALRVAATFALYRSISAASITEEEFRSASEIVLYHLAEALRIYEVAAGDPELTKAERLRQWLIEKNEKFIILSDIYQSGPNEIRTAQVARTAVAILEKHGYLRVRRDEVEVNGVKRREVIEMRQEE